MPNPQFILDPADLPSLNAHLLSLGWPPVESAEKIGDGNMNFTVRARCPEGSLILKQARPFVVKYPQIPAPVERAAVEAAFYRHVAQSPAVSARMPRLLGFCPDSHLLCLEDLGPAADFMPCYSASQPISESDCRQLSAYLQNLHSLPAPAIPNRAMRALNHEHQYRFPLLPANGLALDNITPGLAALAEDLIATPAYVAAVTALGERYLADGPALLHGDFFPGSWLRTPSSVAIIDPEFCFAGEPEYDLGVFLAHLELIHASHLWPLVEREYARPLDWTLARRYAGAELMRRLIGVAQLPVPPSLDAKRRWLHLSRQLLSA